MYLQFIFNFPRKIRQNIEKARHFFLTNYLEALLRGIFQTLLEFQGDGTLLRYIIVNSSLMATILYEKFARSPRMNRAISMDTERERERERRLISKLSRFQSRRLV